MKNKRIFTNYLLLFLIVTLYLGIIFSSFLLYRNNISVLKDYSNYDGKASKVILFIGDGMGENHIKVTEKYYDKEMSFSSLENGYVSTFSQAIFSPTDSAAAATALSTGKKVSNGEVAMHNKKSLETISEYAKAQGKGVGIVTTDSLTGATPASFSAHANNRGDTKNIINTQLTSKVDLFLGAGLSTYQSYHQAFKKAGYNVCTTTQELNNLNNTSDKIIGTFDHVSNKADNDTINPTLQTLTSFAVEYLERNFPNGYFLMIEGAHIDKKSHSNNILKMMEYLDNFSDAVQIGLDYFSNQTNYCLIVTADHETGGLKYADETTEITDSLYRTTGHTSTYVKYFIKSSINIELDKKIDNTDIYKLNKALITKTSSSN